MKKKLFLILFTLAAVISASAKELPKIHVEGKSLVGDSYGWDKTFETIDQEMAWAKQQGMYVIIDRQSIGNQKDEKFTNISRILLKKAAK